MRTALLFFILLFLATPAFSQTVEYTPEVLVSKVLSNPRDILIDENGDIYVADNKTTRVFNKNGSLKSEFGYLNTTGELMFDENKSSISLAQDKDGLIYVMGKTRLVRKIDKEGNTLISFGGFNDVSGITEYSKGVTVDQAGYTYVVFNMTGTIYKYDRNGNQVQTFGGSGSEKGQFRGPTQICVDPTGNLQVADEFNGRVQVITSTGEFVRQISKTENNGAPLFPTDVTVDLQGNTYVADSISAMILKFNSKGKLLKTIGARGPDNGKFITGNLRVALDKSGNIYVLEAFYLNSRSRIQKFDAEGNYITTLIDNRDILENTLIASDQIGNFIVANVHTGQLNKYNRNGQFILTFNSRTSDQTIYQYTIKDIRTDELGNIYVLEQSQNGGVKKFDPNGKLIKRYAPTYSLGSGKTNDYTVPFYPYKLALDTKGNTYIPDYNYVFKYNTAGDLVSKFKLPYPAMKDSLNYGSSLGFGIDKNDIIFSVTDNGFKKYDTDGNYISEFELSDSHTYGGEFPKTIDFDLENNLYVTVYGFIKKYSPDGILLSTSNFHPTLINQGQYSNFSVNGNGSRIAMAANGSVSTFVSNGTLPSYKYGKYYINGTVYLDNNTNCIKEDGEDGSEGLAVMATPGPYYGVTDKNGRYSIEVDSGVYRIAQLLPDEKPSRKITQICADKNLTEYATRTKITTGPDFANTVTLFPHLSVGVSSTRRRRCFDSTTTLTYTNSGFAPASNAKVYLQLPKEVELLSADKPYSRLPNGTYVFEAGTIAPGQKGVITIQDKVVCGDESIRGLTVCTKAWITPGNQGSSSKLAAVTSVTGKCNFETGMVRFVIRNTGQADMVTQKAFRLYLDGQLATIEAYKITAGDSLVFWIPTGGKTARLEADQPDGNGDNTLASATVEACRLVATRVAFSTGFVNAMPTDDEEAEVAEECLSIIDSYDPNDKLVTPVGLTEENYTPTGAALKYKIRFQNTGTDVAYRVVVVDTLSEHLDLSTLQLGSTSHPSRFDIGGKGKPVLTWTFDNIMLPDSTSNEPGSHGYIQFSIKPKADLAEKTAVENFADIYFDFNSPIRTNVTTNRIYDMPPVIEESVRLDAEAIIATPEITSFSPAAGKYGAEVKLSGKRFSTTAASNKIYFNGVQATVVSATETELRVLVPTASVTGKLKIETPDGAASTTEAFEVHQPPVLSSFSPAEGVPGSTVTLQGQHLNTTLIQHIKLGEVDCEVISNAGSTLVVKVPLHALTGTFKVETKGGEAISSAAYIVWHQPYISSLSQHTAIVGATIAIHGVNFAAAAERNKVLFGQVQAQVLQASPERLTVKVPQGATSGYVTVETPGGKATSTASLEVIPAPVFISMTPTKGSVGTTVEITGSHFGAMGAQDEIAFNGVKAQVLAASSTKYTVQVPRGATTGKLKITGFGGEANSTTDFVVETLSPAQAIEVYPNPTTGRFTISFLHADFDIQDVQVYTPAGKLIHTATLETPRPNKLEVNMEVVKPGMYLLQVRTDRGVVIKKLNVL